MGPGSQCGYARSCTGLLLLLLLLVTGCAAPAPDPVLSGPLTRSIYVANHGMHTGLVVHRQDVPTGAWPAREDFPDARFLEVGWGDREYYMREDPGLLLGLRALLLPTLSTVHAVAVRDSPHAEFPDSEIIELRVSEGGFQRLVAFVAGTFARDDQGRAIVLGPGQRPNSRFYASGRKFHLFETCNTWVARALQQAGLPIAPRRAILSEGLMHQLRGREPPQEPDARDSQRTDRGQGRSRVGYRRFHVGAGLPAICSARSRPRPLLQGRVSALSCRSGLARDFGVRPLARRLVQGDAQRRDLASSPIAAKAAPTAVGFGAFM